MGIMDKKKRIQKIVEMRTHALQEQWYKDLADYYDLLPDVTKALPKVLRAGLKGALAIPAFLLGTEDAQATTVYDPVTGKSNFSDDATRQYTYPHGPWEVFNDLQKANEKQKSESYVNFRNKLLQEEARIEEQIGLFKINPDKLDPRTLDALQTYSPDVKLNARRGTKAFKKIKNLEKMFKLMDKGYEPIHIRGEMADKNFLQQLWFINKLRFNPKTKSKKTKGPGYSTTVWRKKDKTPFDGFIPNPSFEEGQPNF